MWPPCASLSSLYRFTAPDPDSCRSPDIIRALFLDMCSWAVCIEHGESDEHCHHFVRPLQRMGDEDAICKRHGVRHELLLADFDYAWLSNEPAEELAEYFYDELWSPRFS